MFALPSDKVNDYATRRRQLLSKGITAGLSGGAITFVAAPAWSQPAASLSKLQEARDQLDLVVQACSVQAWTDAYELACDSSLEKSSYFPSSAALVMIWNSALSDLESCMQLGLAGLK